MYKTVQLMLPDTCAVAQGRLFKKKTHGTRMGSEAV